MGCNCLVEAVTQPSGWQALTNYGLFRYGSSPSVLLQTPGKKYFLNVHTDFWPRWPLWGRDRVLAGKSRALGSGSSSATDSMCGLGHGPSPNPVSVSPTPGHWSLPAIATHCERIENRPTQQMLIAALFIIVPKWKQPKCPSTDKWINKTQYVHTTEYYSVCPHNGILFSQKEEWSTDTCNNMDEVWIQHANWKKPDAGGHTLYDYMISFTWNAHQSNLLQIEIPVPSLIDLAMRKSGVVTG